MLNKNYELNEGATFTYGITGRKTTLACQLLWRSWNMKKRLCTLSLGAVMLLRAGVSFSEGTNCISASCDDAGRPGGDALTFQNQPAPDVKKCSVIPPASPPPVEIPSAKFVSGGPRQEFKVLEGKVSMIIPSRWERTEPVFGADLTLRGPETNGESPLVGVTYLGEMPEIKLQDLKREEEDFRKEFEEWLADKGGMFLKLLPLHPVSLQGAEGFTVGYHYRIDGKEYISRTYNVVCKGNGYNLLSLIPTAAGADALASADKIIFGFSCD
jgi:hypothetical protein